MGWWLTRYGFARMMSLVSNTESTKRIGFFTWRYVSSLIGHYLTAAHPGAGDLVEEPIRKSIDRLAFGGATEADLDKAIDIVRRTSGCPRTVAALRALSTTQATKEAA